MKSIIDVASFLAAIGVWAILPGGNYQAGPLVVSQKSYNLIVEFETGGKVEYQAQGLMHPTYPGGASGPTIGIGYDCGYNTRQQIAQDWGDLLPACTIKRLQDVAGLKGSTAQIAVRRMKDITISWESSITVFERKTMPRFGGLTRGSFPKVTTTPPGVQGATESIVFNRGESMSGSGRLEMREMRDAMPDRLKDIPRYIRRMKRIWEGKHLDGLIRRREAEACLVEESLH